MFLRVLRVLRGENHGDAENREAVTKNLKNAEGNRKGDGPLTLQRLAHQGCRGASHGRPSYRHCLGKHALADSLF